MSLETRAEQAILQRLRDLKGSDAFRNNYPGHLKDFRDNLIEGVSLHDFEEDLKKGAGNELTSKGEEPPKFCAARSSSALAVNTFGPFRHTPQRLSLLGLGPFNQAWFERKCRSGLRTRVPPHLDFLAQAGDAVVATESKFLEPYGTPKQAVFSAQYRRLFYGAEKRPAIAEAPWRAVYDKLVAKPDQYVRLDAAQLVKHYLGIKNTYPHRMRVLLYLYWEPSNAEEFEEVVTHRKEVSDFNARVSGCDTRFVPLSYQTLWADWERSSPWLGMQEHLARLRARYAVSI